MKLQVLGGEGLPLAPLAAAPPGGGDAIALVLPAAAAAQARLVAQESSASAAAGLVKLGSSQEQLLAAAKPLEQAAVIELRWAGGAELACAWPVQRSHAHTCGSPHHVAWSFTSPPNHALAAPASLPPVAATCSRACCLGSAAQRTLARLTPCIATLLRTCEHGVDGLRSDLCVLPACLIDKVCAHDRAVGCLNVCGGWWLLVAVG